MNELKKIIEPFKMTFWSIIGIIVFNYINYQNYGSALLRNITPKTEIIFNNVDLQYSSAKSSSFSRQFSMYFKVYGKTYYASCLGYSDVCQNRRRYHVLDMSYLQIDNKHGIIKTMTIVPSDNLDAEPRVINNGFDSHREPDKLMRIYNEKIQFARWMLYLTLLLLPFGIYKDIKRNKDKDF